MELTNEVVLPVAQPQAWEALNDTAMLKAALPGCEAIDPIGENQYSVTMVAAVGPVKAKFNGKLALEDIQAPNAYTMRFEGQGGAAGFGKGSARVTLEPVDARSTKLRYVANAQVGGKIAQIGSRLVEGAANKVAAEFFDRFSAALAEKYGVVIEPAATTAPQGAWARFVAWLKGLFG